MLLKNKLSLQNILIVVITVAVTMTVTLFYSYLYEKLAPSKAKPGVSGTGLVLVVKGDDARFTDEAFSIGQAKSVFMDIKTGKTRVEIDGRPYLVTPSALHTESADYAVYCLTPIVLLSSYFTHLSVFMICAFLIVFSATVFAVSKSNRRQIADPISNLKISAEKLAAGELDTVIEQQGAGEIRALCDAVERLRLKLKESVYYREKADDNRKFLISGISHDLRTPVTAVRGYIEGVLDGVAITEDKKKAYLETALKKTDAISEMIEDLLLYSKLDLNAVPFELKRVSAADYLEEFVFESQNDYRRENKELIFENTLKSAAFVTIDCAKFGRVLQNIIGNAQKNITEGTGKTEVILRENHGSVIIEIRDNGKGIKKEDLPNIFTRFYRGDAARRTEGSSGLGLTIAKQIVEGLNGRIWVLSTEGKGTSILISLKKTN